MKKYYGMNHFSPEDVIEYDSEKAANEECEYVADVEGTPGDIILVENNDESIGAWNTGCKSESEIKRKIKEAEARWKKAIKENNSESFEDDDVIEWDGESLRVLGVYIGSTYDEESKEELLKADFYELFNGYIDASYVDCDSCSQIQKFIF